MLSATTGSRYKIFSLLIVAGLFFITPVSAQTGDIDHGSEYKACIELVEQAPGDALTSARAWLALGGNNAAKHCAALALAALGRHGEAAGNLSALAALVDPAGPMRPQLLAQAGQAWMLAGNSARAEQALTAALTITPDNTALLIDRAAVRAGTGDYQGAIDDLNPAIAADPENADAHAFRASAYRYIGALKAALDDVNTALTLTPGHPGALLERGIIEHLNGDPEAAGRDWRAVIKTAPTSEAGRAARVNLEKFNAKTD